MAAKNVERSDFNLTTALLLLVMLLVVIVSLLAYMLYDLQGGIGSPSELIRCIPITPTPIY